MNEILIGTVTHFFGHIDVAAIRIDEGTLAVGDTLHIKGHATDLTTTVDSMQIEHAKVRTAGKGDVVGIKLPGKAHEHDNVFKVAP